MPDGESGAVSCLVVDGGAQGSDVHLACSSSSVAEAGAEICLGDCSLAMEKDPRRKARGYQLELCKKAVEENIIVYLGTGCGKTHIAVLLMYELGRFIRKPQKSVCIFLAPTVALVQQQARVIKESTDFKVGIYCGGNKHLKSHSDWEKEISEHEILVMTPQKLLRNLHHCFIRMEYITLLIFDECHHAQIRSSHPYAQIMKMFYETNGSKVPRIFGMTASPIVGKGSSEPENLPKSINSLETLLNAKVYSVENTEELDYFVASPVVRIYYYASAPNDSLCPNMIYQNKLEEIKRQCLTSLNKEASNNRSHQSLLNMKKLLKRTHENITYGLVNLGLWGALQATRLLLSGDNNIRVELMEEIKKSKDHSVCDMYLAQAAEFLSTCFTQDEIASQLSSLAVLKDPFLSRKVLCLVGILSAIRLQPKMKCIIFVNRIITARCLSCILNTVKCLSSWKSDFLVGVNAGMKSMSRKSMKTILERFQSGELNLLVATKVGEEGLDIQTCCFVIRFDMPETVASFIQSRGRARMPRSEYAFLVDSDNPKELDLIKNFKKDEDRMNLEITSRTSKETFPRLDERVYKVDLTGASMSAGYSISLLHHYCSRLPHDEFFLPKPEFYFIDDLGGTICHVVLPSNAPIHQIVSSKLPSMEAAKKDACLKAVEELHNLGVLNDFLLPESKFDNEEESTEDASDSDSSEGEESSRGELYEMVVARVLKQPWDTSMNCVHFHSYYIKFEPHPEDRVYRKFGLFLKSPLPVEGEKMELDLHLARRRSVYTKLFPAGITEFDNNEIKLAELFQEVCLKVILERAKLIPEFVPLGMHDSFRTGFSTFYLLLPVNMHDVESTITVDWETIRRCLSSPIFKDASDSAEENVTPSTGSHIQLANGCRSIDDVKNSLVFTIHKKLFYFVTDVLHERNGYSPFKESSTESHVESAYSVYGIELKHPEQPLLRVKPLFNVRNLLHNRKQKDLEARELEEYFIEIPPELCQLKVIGFSKDIGSSLSLLPSIMHRLENLLVAIELKHVLSASIPEAAEVAAHRVLEALTTEKCQERFSLERLEVLGDAFLKYAVGRRLFLLHASLDEGELTRRRSNVVNNSNLFRLAIKSKLQVYIRDQQFEPGQFFAFGRPCTVTCDEGAAEDIHSLHIGPGAGTLDSNAGEIRCSKGHHWLHKKTIADVVEALVGAFIVDTGFQGATAFLRWIGIDVDFEPSQLRDACIASELYMPLYTLIDLSSLEDLLGYKFRHKGLLIQAFVHPSYNRHGGGCYQRLEFLGDAVLDYLITSYFFTVYPNVKPGQLTDLRSLSVNNKAFANVAVNLSLDRFLFCDSIYLLDAVKEYKDFLALSPSPIALSEGPKCPKVLGDLIESCLGAILLDTGFNLNQVWKIMLSFLDPVKNVSTLQLSPVRELLELCQFHKWDQKISKTKEDGAMSVEITLTKNETCLTVSATRRSKRESRRMAAQLMIKKLKDHGYITTSNPLEKVLKHSCRKEAKLIGYNEEPVSVNDPDNMDSRGPKIEHFDGLTITDSKDSEASSSFCIKPVITRLLPVTEDNLSQRTSGDTSLGTTSEIKGGPIKKTARSRLHETCVANCWKRPDFQCCEEEGLGHLKLFTFKVIVEVDEGPARTLECVGEPRSTKKSAAEHAAKGALWYLEHAGLLHRS